MFPPGTRCPHQPREPELSEGQWALLEPDVLLPVEEVWPVFVATVPAADAIAEMGRALGVALKAPSSAASSTADSGLPGISPTS